MEGNAQRGIKDLMLEAEGPDGLFAIFQEDERAGYFFVYKPETHVVLSQVRIYENSSNIPLRDTDIQLLWSSDRTKCGITLCGQMRGIINIATGEETCVPLESQSRGISDPEWLTGFNNDFMDQYLFIRSRQRYWKEMVKHDHPNIRVLQEEETPPETNFIVHAVGTGNQACVFEDDGQAGYLYLYCLPEQTVVRHLHIYDRSEKLPVTRRDVQVLWSDEGTKCGVKIWGKMRGIIDLASDREGRVWLESRDTPGVADAEWLKGFQS